MPKTKQLLLLGGTGLVIFAGIGVYYFSAEPRPSPAPGLASQSPVAAGSPVAQKATGEAVQMLLQTNGCMSCHAIDKKLVGPAFRDVAARYKGDAQAVDKLSISIRKGGAERWGDAAMPPTPNLSEEQARQLAAFVLQQ